MCIDMPTTTSSSAFTPWCHSDISHNVTCRHTAVTQSHSRKSCLHVLKSRLPTMQHNHMDQYRTSDKCPRHTPRLKRSMYCNHTEDVTCRHSAKLSHLQSSSIKYTKLKKYKTYWPVCQVCRWLVASILAGISHGTQETGSWTSFHPANRAGCSPE